MIFTCLNVCLVKLLIIIVFFYFTIIIVILFVCLPQLILLCPKKDF